MCYLYQEENNGKQVGLREDPCLEVLNVCSGNSEPYLTGEDTTVWKDWAGASGH